MKNLLVLLSFITVSLFSYSQYSVFTVFSDEGELFTVYVDGKKINDKPESRVSDIEYRNEMSNIKVILKDDKSTTIKKNIMLKDVDDNYQKFVFVIKSKKGKYKLKVNSFSAFVPTEEEVVEENVVYEETYTPDVESSNNTESVNLNVNIQADEPVPITTQGANISMNVSAPSRNTSTSETASFSMNINAGEGNDGSNANFSMTVSGNDENATINMSSNAGVSTTTTSSSSSSYSSGTSVHADEQIETNNNYSSSTGCSYPVSGSEFTEIKESINSNSFEDTKLSVAKENAENKCFSSQQVHDIMKLFSFEKNRLSFAKYAYNYVYDKDNYYKTYKAFDFESSINELKESINQNL